jgi:hypothetical protein
MTERDVLTGREAEIAVFGVRLPDEPLEAGPTPFLDSLRAQRGRDAEQTDDES